MNTQTATYCPEDNKLRLYVGRVPREDYLALRAEGWTSTPKQDCDFVAHWTPEREQTALDYAGGIDDEDASPAERAADRAERFAGYRDKRSDEAHAHADRYDTGPTAHGFQSHAKAEKAATKFDRIASRAVNQWDKAEYWQRRTAGVISHALHVSGPSVRMGRILELESEIRKAEKRRAECSTQSPEGPWLTHYRNRLAYETQMLEAQGGRAGVVEMVAGGFIQFRNFRASCPVWVRVQKVNKSPATGRVTSVMVKATGDRWGNTSDGFHLAQVDVERMAPESYRAPSSEELAEFEAATKAEKAEADRIQAIWNEKARDAFFLHNPHYSKNPDYFKPSTVQRITQAVYSARSSGSFARAETENLCGGAVQEPKMWNYNGSKGPVIAKIRTTYGDGNTTNKADSVVILTDKPQKPLPASLWVAYTPKAKEEFAPV
jgi:hypothetical protein